MRNKGVILGSAAIAMSLLVSWPALSQSAVDFGDDTSRWANDGQCDDPRFEGSGAAPVRLPADEGHDATDCRTAFEAGTITLAGPSSSSAPANTRTESGEIDFGDDSGAWANDGECDDPRFGGSLESHIRADATDCREAYDADPSIYIGEASDGDIDFGDDSGSWANDGECDDPRFGGSLESHTRADATDCREAYEADPSIYVGEATGGSVSASDIDFGDDSGSWANDGECDDPRFGGSLTDHRLADATDCREAYEADPSTYVGDLADGDIDFGDDSGSWANDGECDDPRFGGSLTNHRFADATDCREAYAADPSIYVADQTVDAGDIDFGDDTGNWANDGECDDPRFGGSLTDHRLADATDCREAFEAGEVSFIAASDIIIDGIDFGNDGGTYANDGECDDPRFVGRGVGAALDSHYYADATDCSTAYREGTVTLASESGSNNGTSSNFRINFGDDSGAHPNDGECDDPRFQGRGAAMELFDDNILGDATDCRAAYEAGTVTYQP